MSALTRRDRLDDFFPEFFRRLAPPALLAQDVPGEIRLDVRDTDGAYEVRAEIPGARKEDIRVTVDGNFVSIAAEVKHEKEEKKNGRMLLQETCTGSVTRGFSLPGEIDDQKVVARLENGVLMLTLPRRESAAQRTIPVQ